MATGASAQEITVQALDQYLQPVIDAFEAENPGTAIDLQVVSYQSVAESLPVQLASGGGPDISVVTDLGGLSEYYLDLTPYVDQAYFEKQFGMVLDWMRGKDSDPNGIYGLPDSITGHRWLRQQDAVRTGRYRRCPPTDATWARMGRSRPRRLPKQPYTDFPFEMDRSGHRFGAMAISYGRRARRRRRHAGDRRRAAQRHGAIRRMAPGRHNAARPLGCCRRRNHARQLHRFCQCDSTVLYYGGSWQLAPSG